MFEVKSVDAGSAAEYGGIQAGDQIIRINGEALIDYIDYIYFCAQKKLKIKLMRGQTRQTVRIIKDEDEDLGIHFTQPLLGKKRVCRNKCIFCFVDQLPKGMRKSLYVKDEDWRYSFVMGNYVTLASISKPELSRIIRRRVSPLYISVHTVDEALRKYMLGNRNAVSIRKILKKFAARGIHFHAQAVICPGLNDNGKLEQTYRFLRKLYPCAMSLAVVPVGLTAYRDGLYDVSPITQNLAVQTIKKVEKWQKECLNSIGTRFVFAADEYYIKAGMDLPPVENYESFDQIENGVGLMAKFLDEAETALEPGKSAGAHFSIATGEDAYPFLKALGEKASRICGAKIDIYRVKNNTFGGGVTVSGLLGGQDFLNALSGKDLGQALLISGNTLRDNTLFLDGFSLSQISKALGVPVIPVKDGYHFAQIIGQVKEV